MDTSRFYPHQPVLQQEKWTPEEIINMARQLMDKCLSHYESSSHPSSSSSPSQQLSLMGSLYCGGLGPCVYLRLEFAKHLVANGDDSNKEESQQLLQKALEAVQQSNKYEEENHRLSRHDVAFRISLLEGRWVGGKAMECAVLHQLGQTDKARQEANVLIDVLSNSCTSSQLSTCECEVLYGRAGALQAIWFLRNQLDEPTLGRDLAITLARTILSEGRDTARRGNRRHVNLPLLWEWHGTAYLGAAHGVVGILQTLLYLHPDEFALLDQHFQGNVRDWIRETIDGLDELCYPSRNLRSSTSSRQDRLMHWCHGATGHVLLLVKASDFFQDVRYLDRAKQIAMQVLWPRGLLRKGVGLCHGISGNGYVWLSLGRAEPNESSSWTRQAEYFCRFAVNHMTKLELVPDRPYSLYEGAAGLTMLMLDLLHPQDSRFPLYEF